MTSPVIYHCKLAYAYFIASKIKLKNHLIQQAGPELRLLLAELISLRAQKDR